MGNGVCFVCARGLYKYGTTGRSEGVPPPTRAGVRILFG
jgi:hypothetical protein